LLSATVRIPSLTDDTLEKSGMDERSMSVVRPVHVASGFSNAVKVVVAATALAIERDVPTMSGRALAAITHWPVFERTPLGHAILALGFVGSGVSVQEPNATNSAATIAVRVNCWLEWVVGEERFMMPPRRGVRAVRDELQDS
jgi:hypothetical protein